MEVFTAPDLRNDYDKWTENHLSDPEYNSCPRRPSPSSGDRKGPDFGNDGGQTVRRAHANVGHWLKKLDPEVALIMFGTDDLHELEVDE